MATSNTLRAAASDVDLAARVNALAAAAGKGPVTSAQMGQLVALAGIADAYESATLTRDAYLAATPRVVGSDLSAVTDAKLREALTSLEIL
ncbi:hypothetical protein [Tessaracoccus palaemonis]|uniref:Uncharacterized protein n=1 Tax=Tessaracoccus palaemonis TaxID=2829499 RepID=A0ABX8SHB0_9ACTN|nr:hypothetical protein [Tessaracoccus palaemonis]QXT62766.1 hypothetical protein KDB89_13685 [Tessaracoccus palaemonis]